jgi:hypothetical protein
MDDLSEFFGLDLGEVFAALLQLFEGFNDGFRHAAVRFFGAAHDGELLARRNAFMAVFIVEAETDECGGVFALSF